MAWVNPNAIADVMQLQLVTFADKAPKESYYLFDQMQSSLRRFGHEPIILGWGQQWRGLGAKPKLLKSAIDIGKISADVIIWFDAFDVVFSASPERIADVWGGLFNGGVVFNAERNCFPDASIADKHPESASSFRYLNSGFAVGRTGDFFQVLEWMKADEIEDDSRNPDGSGNHPNDQLFFQKAFLSGVLPVELDTNAILCQTLCGVTTDDIEIKGGRIRNKETGSIPLAFHFNGPAKTAGLREPILQALEL